MKGNTTLLLLTLYFEMGLLCNLNKDTIKVTGNKEDAFKRRVNNGF